MKIVQQNTLTVALLIILAAGCTAAPERRDHPSFDSNYEAQRTAAGGAHAGWLYARSVYENPVVRPLSHVTSLASLALKSTGGLFRRAAIGVVQMPALGTDVPELRFADPMDLAAFEEELDAVTGTRRSSGRINFLVDGDEYFCRLTTAIENARESIDIRTYIFDNDDYAVELADRLKVRSLDVRVRVMLDGLGTMMALQTDPATIPVEHRPPLAMQTYIRDDSDIRVRKITNPWFTGDHTKTTIIDKRLAFVGGMNIGREYRYDWHDIMMEVSGPIVDQLQHESDKAWARAGIFGDFANFVEFLKGSKQRSADGGYPIRMLQTKNFDSDIHKAQILAIQSARRYIVIENPYFSDDRTIYELARARQRGVDVRVIIPSAGNHGALNASNKVTVNALLKYGIRVYEYPGMSHVKAAIFDGWASVGSANFDKLSLKINKELNLATSDPETIQALLDQVFIPDLMMSREINSPVPVTLFAHLAEIVVDEAL